MVEQQPRGPLPPGAGPEDSGCPDVAMTLLVPSPSPQWGLSSSFSFWVCLYLINFFSLKVKEGLLCKDLLGKAWLLAVGVGGFLTCSGEGHCSRKRGL